MRQSPAKHPRQRPLNAIFRKLLHHLIIQVFLKPGSRPTIHMRVGMSPQHRHESPAHPDNPAHFTHMPDVPITAVLDMRLATSPPAFGGSWSCASSAMEFATSIAEIAVPLAGRSRAGSSAAAWQSGEIERLSVHGVLLNLVLLHAGLDAYSTACRRACRTATRNLNGNLNAKTASERPAPTGTFRCNLLCNHTRVTSLPLCLMVRAVHALASLVEIGANNGQTWRSVFHHMPQAPGAGCPAPQRISAGWSVGS
jgi:hypothetical protein